MNKNLAPRSYTPRGLENRSRLQLMLSGPENAEVRKIAAQEQRSSSAMCRVLVQEGLALRRQRGVVSEQPHSNGVETQ